MKFKTISVIGLGYIGLPTAAVFASRKISVIGVDVDQHVVNTINHGKIHIVEPDLDMVVSAAVTEGYLRAALQPEPADAFLIAVPTPFKDNHEPDLDYIEAASRAIAPVLKSGDLVVLESTSPVGATEKISRWLAESRTDLSFPHQCGESSNIRIAHCPERVLPGSVLYELVHNDRIIGGMTRKCSDLAVDLYKMIVKGDCIITNSSTAEMAKLTENCFRDLNIAFANELSIICDKLNINVWELIGLANLHPRVNILKPGPGVGGHCIAVDPWFVVSSSPQESLLIRTARQVNDAKPQWVVDKVKKKTERFKRPIVGCLGLSYKADIDDLRESPALEIIRELLFANVGELMVCEPNIQKECLSIGDFEVTLFSFERVVQHSDIIVVLTDHKEFRNIDYDILKDKIVVDTRGIWR